MLRGLRWTAFIRNSNSVLTRNWIAFHGRYGSHLGRPAVAIIAQRQFIIIQNIEFDFYWLKHPLDPQTAFPVGITLSDVSKGWDAPKNINWWSTKVVNEDVTV